MRHSIAEKLNNAVFSFQRIKSRKRIYDKWQREYQLCKLQRIDRFEWISTSKICILCSQWHQSLAQVKIQLDEKILQIVCKDVVQF